LGGAGVGLLGRIYQSVGQVQADPMNPQQWWAAGRTASPAFLSNTLRIFDTIDRGTVLDQNRQPVGDPLGIEGAVATSLGFTPMSVSKERQFKTQEYRATKRMSDEYEMTTRNVADLLRRFQETGDPELLLSANEMYNKYLTSVNGLQDRGAMVGSIANQLSQSRGKVTEPASLKMSETRQNLETAFPSVTPRYQSGLSSLQDQLDVAQLLGQDDVLL